MRTRYLVHPTTHKIVKFLPSNPPEKGEIVTVDGNRRKVIRCKVDWLGPNWTIRRLIVSAVK